MQDSLHSRYFQLTAIGVPDELNQRFLKALVLTPPTTQPPCWSPSKLVLSHPLNFRYFQLTAIGVPDELNQRFLKALVLQEENETEKLKQESQVMNERVAYSYNLFFKCYNYGNYLTANLFGHDGTNKKRP